MNNLQSLIQTSPSLSSIGKEILLYMITKDSTLLWRLLPIFEEERNKLNNIKSEYKSKLDAMEKNYNKQNKISYLKSLESLFHDQQKRLQKIVNEEKQQSIDLDWLLSQI